MPSPYQTAGQIVSRTAVQVGLGPVADAFGSTDPNVAQLCEFLTTAGTDLMREAEWSHLRKEFTLTTVAGVGDYALPPDFRSMVDQSGWNRSTRLPLGGPLSSQQWQYLKARQVGLVFNVLFKLNPQEINLFPSASADGLVIAFEYVSNSWVQSAANIGVVDSAGQAVGDKPAPEANGDVILFDPLLMVRALKVLFLKAKGFDATSAEREYRITLDYEQGRTDGAPTLSLNRGRSGARLVDGTSIPITGFGLTQDNAGTFDGSF